MNGLSERTSSAGIEYVSPALLIVSVKTDRIICGTTGNGDNEGIDYEDWS